MLILGLIVKTIGVIIGLILGGVNDRVNGGWANHHENIS